MTPQELRHKHQSFIQAIPYADFLQKMSSASFIWDAYESLIADFIQVGDW